MIFMFPQRCLDTENNQEGFFCRGPLYNDPWPAGCLYRNEFESDNTIISCIVLESWKI
jgi:hypothetical protein